MKINDQFYTHLPNIIGILAKHKVKNACGGVFANKSLFH